MLPSPYSRNTTFDDELSLRRFPRLIISPRTTNWILSLCHTHGSNNPSLHHSFDLMSSLIDYIFMKSLDKCVMIIINILSSSRISVIFMMRNTILAPRWFVLSSTTFFPSPNTNLFMFCVIPWVPCYPAFVLLYLGILPPFMSRMSWKFHHLLRILGMVILLTITILSWVLVLIPTGVPTSGRCCLDSALLGTLLLWS